MLKRWVSGDRQVLRAAPCVPVTRIRCARRTAGMAPAVLLRGDIAEEAGIVGLEGTAARMLA